MGFFSKDFLKFIYKFLTCFLYVLLLVLSIFLIFANSNSVRAETIIDNRTDTEYTFPDIPSSNFNPNKYVIFKSGTYYYAFSHSSSPDLFSILYDGGNKNLAWYYNNSYVSGTNYVYSCTDGINWVQYNSVYPSATANPFAVDSGWYNPNNLIFANGVDVKYRNGTTIALSTDFEIKPNFINPALFPNASEVQSEQEALTSGNFTFFKVNPGSLTPDDDILLNFYNTTNFDSQNEVVGSYTLNRNSVFFQWTNVEQTEFQYILTARFLGWFQVVNGQSYMAQLGFIRDGETEYINYTWIMSLTSEQQQTEEQKTQQEINQGITDINNFLNDTTSNSSTITNNMPTNDMPDPTATQIDNIFNMFRNVFNTENAQDVVFQVPYTDESITIPANLVISHIPQPILILIQSFYWFLICRFIVKDISKIIEHAKSGEILDASDGNIKTDLL